MTRGVSTVLDVGVFLLLVGAAVASVTAVPPAPPSADGAADDVAFVLATGTARVTYPGPGPANRTATGSLAGLLADAAVSTAALDGRPLLPGARAFERAVAATVRQRLARYGGVQVVAVWRPYPGAPLAGRTTVGPAPPPDARVRAATLSVTAGTPAGRGAVAGSGGADGGVADAVARSVVWTLFPPGPAGDALRRSPPATGLRRQYRTAARGLDADVEEPLRRDDAVAANRRLAAALGEHLARDLQGRFDDPGAAARSVAVRRVRITVRTWSP